jgi:hypothetical protein
VDGFAPGRSRLKTRNGLKARPQKSAGLQIHLYNRREISNIARDEREPK